MRSSATLLDMTQCKGVKLKNESRLIHIHAFVQFRLDTSKVAGLGSIVNRVGEGVYGQQ